MLFMTKMFNSVAAWVVSEIVLVPKLADRVQVPKRETGLSGKRPQAGNRPKWENALTGKRP